LARKRSARALDNDKTIRAAAIELILSKGLDAISFREVGKAAGLSHGALYARFEDVEELLVDLWNEVLGRRVISLFESAKAAATYPSEDSIAVVLQRVRDAEQVDVAAVQVLLLSRRFLVLREDVEVFIHDYLESCPTDEVDAIWSRTMVLFSLIMVKIFSNSEFGLSHERLNFMQPVLTATLSVSPKEVRPMAYVEPEVLVDGAHQDNLLSQLAYCTYGAVGTSGYTNATISRISRRANCSPGAIYKLFPSKEDLVIYATRRMMSGERMSPSRLASVLNEEDLAQTLYASASSQNNLRKNFLMEMMLASAQNSKLRGAIGEQQQNLEKIASSISDISDEEGKRLQYMFREVTLLILGVTFLSTITGATSTIDFAQFSEPFREALLQLCFPSWENIARQLQAFAPLEHGVPSVNVDTPSEKS
jgi:AcrR family transcriptional regulator